MFIIAINGMVFGPFDTLTGAQSYAKTHYFNVVLLEYPIVDAAYKSFGEQAAIIKLIKPLPE